jgi:prepilin-type N-terminal cleavage/methylation domain-containing protein
VVSERGFTLIEVLVAMVVLSIGILGTLQATLLAARLESRSRAITSGTLLSQERLERIGALGWEKATQGLPARPLPQSIGMGGEHLQEEVTRSGARFLLVFQRAGGQDEPPLCTVRCYWAGGREAFSSRQVVTLSVRRTR